MILFVLLIIPRPLLAGDDTALLDRVMGNPFTAEAVKKNINIFTEALKNHFALWLERSGKYMDMMKGILTEHDIPEEMVYVAMIESGFSPYAYSHAKAVGPWQFIDATAKKYGLKINWWVDERRDPIKSTQAAAEYLGNLHRMFGSWELAMSAYNAGEGAIRRALQRIGGDSYFDLNYSRHIRPETKNYVPKFVAASLIANDPAEYGFKQVEDRDYDYDEAVIYSPLDLNAAAKCAGVTFERMKELNPELTRWCTPPNVDKYVLNIPRGTLMSFLENLYKLTPQERFPLKVYRARRGDSLKKVARRFRLPVRVITELNDLKLGTRLKRGQRIYLPPAGKYKDDYIIASNKALRRAHAIRHRHIIRHKRRHLAKKHYAVVARK